MECYDNLVQIEDELGAHNYKPLEVVITRGERVWVWDEERRKYLACAVARMALRVLVEEGMVENSAQMGEYFRQGLKQIAGPLVKEVRGKGLMIGIELLPEGGGARQYCEKLKELGVLCKDTHGHTIRVAPPLVITREEIDWTLERFDSVLSAR